jgi:hypothetical protein
MNPEQFDEISPDSTSGVGFLLGFSAIHLISPESFSGFGIVMSNRIR